MASSEPFKFATALVIDDNEHMIAITSTMLRAFGFGQVLGVDSAHKGRDVLTDTEIDLVVVDYRMPQMDGLSFVRWLRRAPDSPNRFVPIIMLTAHSDEMRIHKARDTGVTEFLCKPLAPTELFKKVATTIEHPRAFVSTEHFFGPDRRRRQEATYPGQDRRKRVPKIFVEDIRA